MKSRTKLVIIFLGIVVFGVSHYLRSSSWWQITQNVKKTGQMIVLDKQGTPVILEWYKTDMKSSDFSAIAQSVSSLVVSAFMPIEMNFLRQYPQAVFQDEYLKSFEPLFVNEQAVNWDDVEKVMLERLKQACSPDFSNLSSEVIATFPSDIYFFVMAKDQATSDLLGFAQFGIAPNYKYGDVKVIGLGVQPAVQNHGLGKILISSIFFIVPKIERLVVCTRITNDKALQAYRTWGFVLDTHPMIDPFFTMIIEHWIHLQYFADEVDGLQKLAKTFVIKC